NGVWPMREVARLEAERRKLLEREIEGLDLPAQKLEAESVDKLSNAVTGEASEPVIVTSSRRTPRAIKARVTTPSKSPRKRKLAG
ncbi:MAG: hypothetical protein EBY15_13575, partial [Gammaproteobacteria bacterium]|nr:hypothetical protein [Gammaproteobacteria bacterium]